MTTFPWFKQGTFQIDPNATPEEIKRRREKLADMKYGNARYVGEGLGHLATGILSGIQGRKLDAAERTGRESATALFDSLIRGGGAPVPSSSTGPMTVLGVPPVETRTEPEAIAAETMAVLGKGPSEDVSAFNSGLAGTESGGRYNIVNSEGYSGKYQFGQARLDDYNRANGTSYRTADLVAGTPEARALTEQVQNWHVGDIDAYITENGLDQFVGQTIGGVPMTLNGMRAMAHLGGKEGMRKFLQTGGQYNPSDSNGTSLLDYAGTHGGGSRPTQSAPTADMGALYAALSNPWLSAEQKSIVSSMITQQQQAMDPLRQLQIQTAQANLDAMRNPAPGDRKIIKDASGRQRFVDTGEYVFPDSGAGAPVIDFETEQKLRKEFLGLDVYKDFSKVNDSWDRIRASAEDPSAAGDLALIFNYMKMLDPGSVVRESEFATAQNAAGVDERIRNTYNRILSGERLAPEQRTDFFDRAGMLFNAQAGNYNDKATYYRGLADEYNVSADRIAKLVDLYEVTPEDAAKHLAETEDPTTEEPNPFAGEPFPTEPDAVGAFIDQVLPTLNDHELKMWNGATQQQRVQFLMNRWKELHGAAQ